MKIQHIANVAPETWQTLVEASDDTWLYHTQPWLELSTHVWPFENHYFLAEENGTLVGAFPVQLARSRRRYTFYRHGGSLLMGSAGPFCVRGLPGKSRERTLTQITEAAVAWAKREKIALLSCALPPLAAPNLHCTHGVNPLVTVGWRDTSTHTRIVDIGKAEAVLWSDLAADARRSVKLARAAGYTVQREDWAELWPEYYRAHSETYQRTGVAPHPQAYFEAIATQIAKRGQAVLWVGREPAGRPVAFHNCARYRDGSLYWTGCCETAHLASGINYLLFWEALLGAKADGCAWYEIGESFPDQHSGKLWGLTLFKSKFGGELYRYYRGEIQVLHQPGLSFLRQTAGAARQAVGMARQRAKAASAQWRSG